MYSALLMCLLLCQMLSPFKLKYQFSFDFSVEETEAQIIEAPCLTSHNK